MNLVLLFVSSRVLSWCLQARRSNTNCSCCQLLVAWLSCQLIDRSLLPADTTGTMGVKCCSPCSVAHLLVEHSEIVSCFSRYRQETWNFLPPGFRNHFQYKFQMKQKPGYFHLRIILCIFALEYKEWIFYYQNL